MVDHTGYLGAFLKPTINPLRSGVPGGERGWLVKKEQLGVGTAQTLRRRPLKLSRQQIHCRDAQRRVVSVLRLCENARRGCP